MSLSRRISVEEKLRASTGPSSARVWGWGSRLHGPISESGGAFWAFFRVPLEDDCKPLSQTQAQKEPQKIKLMVTEGVCDTEKAKF